MNDVHITVYADPMTTKIREYKQKGLIDMSTTWLRPLPDSDSVKHVFQIVTTAKTYTVYVKSATEKVCHALYNMM